MKRRLQKLRIPRRLSVPAASLAAAAFLFASSVPLAPAAAADEIRTVTVGVIDTFAPDAWPSLIGPTLDGLREALPLYRFEAVEIETEDDLKAYRDKLDFFLSSSTFYWSAHLEHGASAVAAVDPAFTPDPQRAVAGLVLARSGNSGIRTLRDLKGRTLAVTGNRGAPDAEEGSNPGAGLSAGFSDEYLALRGTLEEKGWNSARFFSTVKPVGWRNPGVPSALLANAADAGVLSLCEFEQLAKRSAFRKEDFKAIDAAVDPKSGCLATTDFYPGTVLAAMPRAEASVVTAVASALFAMPPMAGDSWMIANDFRKTDELARQLAIGPYAYLQEITPKALWRRFPLEILLTGSLAAALLWHLARVNGLVLRRTRELREALSQRDALERKSRQSRENLAALEKVGLINQLSSLIAHELKQPLGAINNFGNGLLRRVKRGQLDPKVLAETLEDIVGQGTRASEIVDRVRGYAKHPDPIMQVCDMVPVLEKAINEFKHIHPEAPHILLKCLPYSWAEVDAWEIQLAVLNLLKNASEALQGCPDPEIIVRLREKDGKWRLTVEDNGREIAREKTDLFFEPLYTGKMTGMGLGLSIVANIAERHKGHVSAEPNEALGHGCVMVMVLPIAKSPLLEAEAKARASR